MCLFILWRYQFWSAAWSSWLALMLETRIYPLRWLEIVFLGVRSDLVQIVLHFENIWLRKIHLQHKQWLWHKNRAKISKKLSRLKQIYTFLPCLPFVAYLVHAQMLILWTWIFFAFFDAYQHIFPTTVGDCHVQEMSIPVSKNFCQQKTK